MKKTYSKCIETLSEGDEIDVKIGIYKVFSSPENWHTYLSIKITNSLQVTAG